MKPTSFHLKIEHLWGLIVLVGIFIFVNTHPIRPNDFWWHIAVGREFIATGKIPATDVYSFTEAGQPYPSYQMFWLMDAFLYELYALGGPALIVFVHSLMITSAYSIIFWLCLRITQSWRIAAFGALFAAALGLNDWNVRPQGITFLLAGLILLALFQYRRSHHWPWLILIPISLAVWVNSHGTFIIGLALIGIWFGQELWDAIIAKVRGEHKSAMVSIGVPGLLFIISLLVCLINPRGIGIIGYLKTLTGNSVVQNLVLEWAPPTLSTSLGITFFSCFLGSAVLLALSPKRPNLYQILTFVAFSLLAIKTSRGIVWFGLVFAPIVAEHLSALIQLLQRSRQGSKVGEGSKMVNTIFTFVFLLMAVISLPWFKSILPLPAAKSGLLSSDTPVQATRFLLAENPPGKLFNSMSFGSYLIWAAYPQYQVFVDPRIELFSERVWMDYLNISSANGDWETRLKDYRVNTLLLSPVEQPGLIRAAQTSPNWSVLYQDGSTMIFGRN